MPLERRHNWRNWRSWREWRSWVALAMLANAALWAAPACAQSEPFTLAQLTQLLAQVKAGEATFTEKRAVAVLERTLESSGRLSFEVPDTFVRETLKPRREKLAVVGNTVTLSQGTRSRTLALDAVPEAAVIEIGRASCRERVLVQV